MTNKQQINRFKDMAELAWASYGYFHYFLEQHNKSDYIDKVRYIDAKDENGKDKLDNNNKKGRFINLQKDYIRNIDNISIQGQILLCPSGMDRVRVKVE